MNLDSPYFDLFENNKNISNLSIEALSEAWIDVKSFEQIVTETRRKIEEFIYIKTNSESSYEKEGIEHINVHEKFRISITHKLNRKIDYEMAKDIAIEMGLENVLESIVKFKPELNVKALKCADINIVQDFFPSITTKPARPAFKITKI